MSAREGRRGAASAALCYLAAARNGPVTLVFAAREETRNNAAMLKGVLEDML
jgi:uncharacterized protein YeaO (DUF488 family)